MNKPPLPNEYADAITTELQQLNSDRDLSGDVNEADVMRTIRSTLQRFGAPNDVIRDVLNDRSAIEYFLARIEGKDFDDSEEEDDLNFESKLNTAFGLI
jgi:hypothetical protein